MNQRNARTPPQNSLVNRRSFTVTYILLIVRPAADRTAKSPEYKKSESQTAVRLDQKDVDKLCQGTQVYMKLSKKTAEKCAQLISFPRPTVSNLNFCSAFSSISFDIEAAIGIIKSADRTHCEKHCKNTNNLQKTPTRPAIKARKPPTACLQTHSFRLVQLHLFYQSS